jgi:signal transduction histidine kinase/DNA-binding response OmpR family regulator/ligand-binding sensor domain-containing protein
MYLKIRLCFALVSGFATLYAQSPLLERITIEHGLSQGMIFDMVQTRDGFLWIATKDGLNRYDGYNFKIFSNDPFDPYSLSENTITALFEDSRGLLWAGTESKGINVYDPRSGRFHHFELSFGRSMQGVEFEVTRIAEAPDGSIYLLQNGNGLVRIALPASWQGKLPDSPELSPEANVTLFPMEQFSAPAEPSQVELTALEILPNGATRVYTGAAAYQALPDKGFVRPVDWSKEQNITEVWGSLPGHLIRFRGADRYTPVNTSGTPVGRVTAKAEAGGAWWVSINHELWHLQPGEELDLAKPDWTIDARITTVTSDRNGNVWVGTQGYGLRKINLRKQRFNSGAEGNSIWGLWRSLDGAYFCKIVNEVYSYNPVSGAIASQRAFGGIPHRVLDMAFAPDGTYWLLGRTEAEEGDVEIRRYNPTNGQGRSYPFSKDIITNGKSQPFKIYPYTRLIHTHDDKLLATGVNCLLAQLDPHSGRYEYFDYAAAFKEKPETIRAIALAESPDGAWWIGTQQGLVKGIPDGNSRRFELTKATPVNTQGLNNNSIACLLPDPEYPNDILWIGTKGGGINRLDIRSGRITHLGARQGLPDNVVYGILPGKQNELWCSTNRGLARIRLDQQRMPLSITAFTAAQGLQDNEFNTQAYFKAANGELLFGGVNGLNHFLPEEVLPDTTPPPVYLVGLRINQQPAADVLLTVNALPALDLLKELKVRYDQNNLSFEFAVLDFTDPAKNRYRYRLVGADHGWVETGTYRFAHFTHLAPGRYVLLAEGNNGEGGWQALGYPISVIITPPWWRSWPAYISYVVLMTMLVWQAYRFQVRRVKEREQLAYEHRETQRVKAVEEMKTNFFNNITHEFRTPLSLILEPARRIRAKSNEAETITQASRIETNSVRLLDMVNQLLDLAKLESGSMSADFRRGNLEAAMREWVQLFLPLADQRGVQLSFAAQGPLDAVVFDYNKTELIVNNLISNALKFTPQGGQVKVDIRILGYSQDANIAPNIPISKSSNIPISQSPHISITVKDTGIGISEKDQIRIFDRFYQAENTAAQHIKGSGIGLALSKELAELLGGRLRVQSSPGNGAVFTLYLPLNAAPVSLDPIVKKEQNKEAVVSSAPLRYADDLDKPIALLVEDNAELRDFVQECIGDRWQVVEASNGAEGIEKARLLVPDIVISDVMMPLKNGFEVCEALKNDELTAHIPIVLLTAKSAMDAKITGLRTGADDYLTKPFNTEELLARMENLLEQRRRLRRKYVQEHTANKPILLSEHISEPDRDFLQRFTALVDQHLSDENMTVEELARQMLLSRVQLHRKLKALTDQNVSDFVRDYRLDRAMAMLRNKEGLVYEVAYKVGFGSEKYFSRAFKEKFGVPPSQVK